MKTKIFSVIVVGLIVLQLMSCHKNTIQYNATLLDYKGLDGCSWIIKTDAGKYYEPVNLADFEPHPQNNERIEISFIPVSGLSICMVGETIRLQTLKK